MKVAIINNNLIDVNLIDPNVKMYVFIEKGYLLRDKLDLEGKAVVLAGDFDTLNLDDIKIHEGDELIKLEPEKALTDTEAAIEMLAREDMYISVYTHNGGRIDHAYSMFNYLKKYDNLTFIDNQNIYYAKNPGNYELFNANFDYISFFALEDVENLTLNGFKYELENYDLASTDSLCISNEFKSTFANISFTKGKVMITYAKDSK